MIRLVHVEDMPLLHSSSEVAAVHLTVVVACTGCCLICQMYSRNETLSDSSMYHDYPLALIHQSDYSWHSVPISAFLGYVGSINSPLIYVNQLMSKLLQLQFLLVGCQMQTNNVLFLNQYFCPLSSSNCPQEDASSSQEFQDFQQIICLMSMLDGESSETAFL